MKHYVQNTSQRVWHIVEAQEMVAIIILNCLFTPLISTIKSLFDLHRLPPPQPTLHTHAQLLPEHFFYLFSLGLPVYAIETTETGKWAATPGQAPPLCFSILGCLNLAGREMPCHLPIPVQENRC